MNLSDLLPHLLYQFKSEVELIRAIEEISLKFTKERNKITDYLNDPRLVSAYAAFYTLTNIPKLKSIEHWLPAEWLMQIKNAAFIDLGAGPGTFSLAWKELNGKGDVYQVETSQLMREQAKKIWEGLHQSPLKQGSRFEWNLDQEKVLFFGHSANEMGAETAIRYIEQINPEHILFIEPGTKDFFPLMLKIRDYLIAQNFNVLYPCPKPLPCPMRGSEDWCHQFIQVKQSDEIERISQMAKLDRKLLPLTVQAFSRTFKTETPAERLVRVFPETKFSFEWEVCHNNELEKYQIMKRDLSKKGVKDLGHILSGEGIETEPVKTTEQSKRVKLIKIL